MIPVAEAQRRIVAAFSPLPAEQVGLTGATGRVLAADIASRVTQPPVALSAMDGFAVRAADIAAIPVTLKLVGSAPAGGAYAGTVGKGEAVRIFTGAPVPQGADTIVIQENAALDGGRVTMRESAPPGHYVRPAGLDFKSGEIGLRAGRMLDARDIGLAAAMNVPWLKVRRRPRIAILATGNEIVMPGEPIGPNQIVSSNGPALAAFLAAHGAEPVDLGIARDDVASLRSLAAGARGMDLLVTTGGASVGDHDLVQKALAADGLAVDFWRIAMRPGKPLMFGRYGDTPLLGLPGNPVSSLVCAIIFLRPAIDAMLGFQRPALASRAVLGIDLPANDSRQDYLRATLAPGSGGLPVATPFAKQDSSMMSLLAKADCLVIRPPQAPQARAGDAVEIIPLSGL